ncbi:MAG: pyruvate kinase [Phycisphaerae bacterium]|nr:pyruvate kinase [Phycisphaerae bacterium]
MATPTSPLPLPRSRTDAPPAIRAGARLTLATIVATIGPASQSPDVLRRLVLAGVNVVRFNFSHGTEAEHAQRLTAVRQASRDVSIPVAVLGDLPGPKTRLTKVPEPGIDLQPGHDVTIDPNLAEAIPGETPRLGCTIPGIAASVHPGHKVLINDGAVRLLCVERERGDAPQSIRCRVVVGGLITTGKGVNFPQSELSIRAMSERDWQWARWAVDNDLDYLALSFVRSAEEVQELKRFLLDRARDRGVLDASGQPLGIPVVAKIEKPQAVTEIDAIADASDALMVARGDLGVETDVAQVPVIQKRIIACADARGKPCIVATQMLETMITASTPTRAEASDVANAIFDGAEAVMLSGETAVGKHPVLVVETMKRIVGVAEAELAARAAGAHPITPALPTRIVEPARVRTAALAEAAWHAARTWNARLIAVWSQEGGAARFLSQSGINLPILAFSSSDRATRRMQLYRGVTAIRMDTPPTLADWNLEVDRRAAALEMAHAGDPIVLVAGIPIGQRGSPSAVALHRIGEHAGGFAQHRC